MQAIPTPCRERVHLLGLRHGLHQLHGGALLCCAQLSFYIGREDTLHVGKDFATSSYQLSERSLPGRVRPDAALHRTADLPRS